jgi:hypothetical protein
LKLWIAAAGISIVAWLLSGWCDIYVQWPAGYFGIFGGRIGTEGAHLAQSTGLHLTLLREHTGLLPPVERPWYWYDGGRDRTSWHLMLPMWMLCIGTGLAMALSIVQRRRRPPGCQCGYDTRGLARCPECGAMQARSPV